MLPSVSVWAVRFRFSLRLREAVPFPPHPVSTVSVRAAPLSGSPAARSSAPLNQTMLCAFEELLASTLQRINPSRRATCASAISVTFRQKRASFDIYFVSALVAIPTLVICARRNVSINVINFCTGNSRSGRITMATSGLACFNWASCAVSVFQSTT